MIWHLLLKWSTGKLLAVTGMNKKIEKRKYVHLGLRILNLSKINMYYFWYNYIEENIMTKINPITLIQTYPSFISKLNLYMYIF